MKRSIAYIASGELNGFFTLRVVNYAPVTRGDGSALYYVGRDHYIQNLSTDWDTAFQKYEDYANVGGLRLGTKKEDQFELTAWGTGCPKGFSYSRFLIWEDLINDGMMPFGKHKYQKLVNLEPGYRVFMRKWLSDMVTNSKTEAERRVWGLALKGLNAFAVEDDKIAEKAEAKKRKIAEQRDAIKAASKHVGIIGDRTTATLTCYAEFQYDSQWGGGVIRLFRDENLNTLKTFGKSPIKKGETATVKFTIKKHEEYKGEQQTLITRINEVG